MPTNINPISPAATEGVVAQSSTGVASNLLPALPLQVIGNDGAGGVGVTQLVAGSNVSLLQAGDEITISSGLSVWNSILSSSLTFNFVAPITQSVTSLSSTIPYSSTAVQNSQVFTCTALTSVLTADYAINLSTTAVTSNGSPLTFVIATYLTTGGAPTAGQLPIDVQPVQITSTTSTLTSSAQQAALNLSIALQPTTTTFALYVVPYIYIQSGVTISGTDFSAASDSVGYVFESNKYSVATPTSVNQLQIYKANFTVSSFTATTAIPKQNTGTILFSTGTVSVGATPALTRISFTVPGYFGNTVNGGQTFIWSYFIFVNGTQVYTNIIGNGDSQSFVYDQLTIDVPLLNIADGSTVNINLSYSTYTGGALEAYFAAYGLSSGNYFSSYYSVFAQDATTATGTLSLANEGQTVVPIPSDVSLPTATTIAVYTPTSSIVPSAFPTTSAYLIDTVQVNLDISQNLYRVNFSCVIYTNAFSSVSTDDPCIAVYIYQTTGTGVSTTPVTGVGITKKSVRSYASGSLYAVTVVCEGYINLLAASQFSAYACLFSTTSNVTSTQFVAVGQGSTLVSNAQSQWTIAAQSIGTSSGSGGTTTITADAGSYLTATTTTGGYDLGTVQASTTQAGLLSTSNIIPANDLLQQGATSVVGCTLTSTNGSVTVTTTEGNIDLATVAAASSGAIGIYSPLNQAVSTLSTDLPITTVYVSETPTLAQMQTIASQSITAKYSNANGVGSNLQVSVVTGAYTTNTSAFGLQLCLFSSEDGFTAPLAYPYIQQGACSANTRENYANFSLEAIVPSQQGVSVTFAVGAAVQSGLSASIDASSFTFIAQEDVSDTQSLVSSTTIDLGTGNVTVPSGSNVTLTTVNLTKQYNNSYYVLQGGINVIGSATNGYIIPNINVSAVQSGASPSTYGGVILGSGKPGTSISAGGGINTLIPVYVSMYETSSSNQILPNGQYAFTLKAFATYTSATVGNVTTPSYIVNKTASLLYVDEVLPISDGGDIQTQQILPVTVTTTPYVTTLSPQYSTLTPVTSLLTVSRAGGSNLIFTFSVQNHSIGSTSGTTTQNAEGEIIVGFYTSNASTATPYAVRRITNPSSSSTNPTTAVFRVVVQSPAPETPISLYIAVGSLTSTFTTQSVTLSGTFVENYNGSTSTQGTLTAVDVAANSYLQSSTSGSTVTLNTTQSSISQAGLLATSASVPANNLIQMGTTGAQGCTLASSDSTVIITPSSGSINLSSGLTLSAGTGSAAQVRNNTLNIASVYPNVAWTADYLSAGISSGSTKPIYDSTAQYVPAYTASSSQLNLSEYTRFTATSAIPPSANNTATPQWIAVLQPSSNTVFQARTIELLVQPYLLGATSVQGQAFALNAYYRMVLGVNITGTATPINFSAMTPLPLSIDGYGASGVPTVADTPPWLTFAVLPAASSPSSQFTTGNVLVVYAQWILSQTAGITVGFNLAFRTLF